MKREPSSRTTDSSERLAIDLARQLQSSESSILEAGSCGPSETIKVAQPERLLISDSHIKIEPRADVKSIAKLTQQIKSYKKRRRNELDILFNTRGSSDVEQRILSAHQIEAELHDRAKRIKREEDSGSSPLIERMKRSNRADKRRTLECQSDKEQERPVAVSGKHGPSRWRQRIDNPLFCTPDPEGNLQSSGQRGSPLASVEYPQKKAQCLPRQHSEQIHPPAASVITRAQYKDLIARSSHEPIDGDRNPFNGSYSRTSSLGSRRGQSSKNGTRLRTDFADIELSGGTSLDYPHSWTQATVADRRLVEMRDRGVFWNVVRDKWQDTTERQIAPETLKIRHRYLVSLRNSQSIIPGSGTHIEDGADVTSENAGKSKKCPSKVPRASQNERIDSNDDDDDFRDDNSGQSSESEEDSEPRGHARAIRSQSSHNIKQRISPSASTAVKHVPESQKNPSSLEFSNQETSTNSAYGSSSWKLASRQAKSQNPLEKYYKHLIIVFKGSGLATEHEEPGTAVRAVGLTASIFQNECIDSKAPEVSKEMFLPCNGLQSTREEPLDKQDV